MEWLEWIVQFEGGKYLNIATPRGGILPGTFASINYQADQPQQEVNHTPSEYVMKAIRNLAFSNRKRIR